MTSSRGQDVVITCRQTPDTPLLLLRLHVYKDTDSHLSDHISYITQNTLGYKVFAMDLKHLYTKTTPIHTSTAEAVELYMYEALTGSQSAYL